MLIGDDVASPAPLQSLSTYEAIFKKQQRLCNALTSKCKEEGAKESINNAWTSSASLLTVLQRLQHDDTKPTTRIELYAQYTSCLRYMLLSSEQLLTALDRETNKYRSANELSRHTSHDTNFLLEHGKWDKASLTVRVRQYARDSSYGELALRNINRCAINQGPLRSLLYKLSRFVSGDDHYTIEHINSGIKGLIDDHSAMTKAIASYLLSTPESVKRLPPFVTELEKQFKAFSHESFSSMGLNEANNSIAPEKQRLDDNLLKLRGHIIGYNAKASAYAIKNICHNLLDNLLPQLAGTLYDLYHINVEEAHGRFTSALLLDQEICEEVLYALAKEQLLDVDPKEIDHDLMQLAQKVTKQAFSREEKEFLESGKERRMLLRYPESYVRIYGSQQNSTMATLKSINDGAISLVKRYSVAHKAPDEAALDILATIQGRIANEAALLETLIGKLIAQA